MATSASGIVSTIGLIRCRSANVIVSSMSWAAPPAWPRTAPALMMSCSGETCSESAITASVMTSPWVASPSTAALIASALAAWRGDSSGSYPLQAYWAGTDGTLWRSSTDLQSGFVQMYTDTAVTRMAVDDRDTVYDINSSGKPVQYGDDAWTSVDLGDNSERYIAVDVAVATDDDTVWFVMKEGQD